jgi:hypothetical protein
MANGCALIVTAISIISEMTKMSSISAFWNKITVNYGSNYFFALPSDSLIVWTYFGFYLTVLILTAVFYFYFSHKKNGAKPYQIFARGFLWPNVTLAITGLILTFFRYEQIQVLSWRFWMYLLLAIIIAFNAWYFTARRQKLIDELEALSEKKRKDKWLKKGR